MDGGRRLAFERSFSLEREVKPKRSFWTRVVDVIAGQPDFHYLVSPYSVTTDSRGRILVTDVAAAGVHIFDFQQQKYKFLTRRDAGKDPMLTPQCVAVDAQDNIYVTDSQAGKVFVFDANGKYRRAIGSLKGGEGYFKRPTGIAVDSAAQRIYVTDTLRNKIYMMDMQGSVLQVIGKTGAGEGEFNFPTELRLNGQELVVVDAMNFRVQVLDRFRNVQVCDREDWRWGGMDFSSEGNWNRFGGTSVRGGWAVGNGAGVRPRGTAAVLLWRARDGTGTVPAADRIADRQSRSNLCSGLIQSAGRGISLLRDWGGGEEGAMRAVSPRRVLAVLVFAAMVAGVAAGQTPPPTADVLGMHNLSVASGASVYSQGSLGCTFCHAPHSGLGGISPLWNQKYSNASYTPYTSSTYVEQGNTKPTLGITSSLCLSCHDGTVGVGQSAAYGPLPVVGSMNAVDSFGTTLTGSHPFSLVLPMKDSPDLVSSLVASGKTADPTGAVKLVNGNIECTSCHDPHIQTIDKIAQNFLVRDSSNGQMCLACHDPNRVVQGQVNSLAGFTNSIHQTATNQVSPDGHVGQYPTVGVRCMHVVPHVA